MAKVSISVTLDSEVMRLLENKQGKKSEMINTLLKRVLRTEEGINEEIKHYKDKIKMLEQELINLSQRDKQRVENIPDRLKDKLKSVKGILERHPEKSYIWTGIINREYQRDFTESELKQLIERWA